MPYVNVTAGSSKLSGVTVTGTAASGDVPVASSASAAAWAFPPGFEVGYDQITAAVNVASTTEATPTLIITCASHTFDGGAVVVEFYAPYIQTGSSGATSVTVALWEGVSEITRLGFTSFGGAGAQFLTAQSMRFRFTPTVGAHTYLIQAFAGTVTGTPQVGAGTGSGAAYPPAFARFTKV